MKITKPDGDETETGEHLRNHKLYLRRLEDEGVPLKPIDPQLRPLRQFQLAHLAATLASRSASGASECAAEAMQFWNASGRVLVSEAQTGVLVKGLFCLERDDWDAHGKALIASLDDLEGAVPGQNLSEEVDKSNEAAQAKAGLAVSQVWRGGPSNPMALRRLFPGQAETEETRGEKFLSLLAFAKTGVETCESLAWRAKDSDRLKWCVLHAWAPLRIWDDAVFQKGLRVARSLIEKPEGALAACRVAGYPFVARWLAVMRQEQQATAKKRP